MRPLRSALFVAGSDPDEIEAGLQSGTDALIIDLEEPRTPFTEAQREDARRLVSSVLDRAPAAGAAPLLFCRVQAPAHGSDAEGSAGRAAPVAHGSAHPEVARA
jgi:citrate lyase subunit beta/citryl-CoA lyase